MLGGCKATEHNRHCDACGERWRLISEPQDVEAGSGGGRDEESDAVDNKAEASWAIHVIHPPYLPSSISTALRLPPPGEQNSKAGMGSHCDLKDCNEQSDNFAWTPRGPGPATCKGLTSSWTADESRDLGGLLFAGQGICL
eukprot:273539-Rhodomonas_salina.2